MRRSLLLLCVIAATAVASPLRRPSILGRLGKATAGIAIGSAATNMATGIASQSIGLAGQALGQIPFIGPLAQVGTTIGQAGVDVGNGFAQMGLGIGQAGVNSHLATAAPSLPAGQNDMTGIADNTRATEESAPALQQSIPNQNQPDSQQVPGNVDYPSYDYDDYYNGNQDQNPQNAVSPDNGAPATSRPPPPQPIYIGAK